MGVRITQLVVETTMRAFPAARITQHVIEAVISDIAYPPQARISQTVIEVVLLTSSLPVITSRYGPRVQAV
jgi:hypothetical protein